MNKIFLFLVFIVSTLVSKDFYVPRPYFYYESGVFLSNNPDAKYYTMEQINDVKIGNHIRNKMGYCITEYETTNVIPFGCYETYNTLNYYITRPEGLLRKDILEYYHDMPLDEYEKLFRVTKKDVQKHLNRYSNHMDKQFRENFTDDFLYKLRNEQMNR